MASTCLWLLVPGWLSKGHHEWAEMSCWRLVSILQEARPDLGWSGWVEGVGGWGLGSDLHLAPRKRREADVCTWSEGRKAQQGSQSSCDCHVGFASFTAPVNYTRFVLGTAGKVPPSVLLLHELVWLCSSQDFSPRFCRQLFDCLSQR